MTPWPWSAIVFVPAAFAVGVFWGLWLAERRMRRQLAASRAISEAAARHMIARRLPK